MSPILKNENSEITEILQKGYNTEMWECNFKISWNAVQMTSNSKSFSHIANLVAGIWSLKAFDPCGYINLISFLLCQFKDVIFLVSFNTQKVKIVINKQVHIYLSFIDPKIKIFCDFQVFVLSPIPKNQNSEIMEILQKGLNTEMWGCSWNAVQMT